MSFKTLEQVINTVYAVSELLSVEKISKKQITDRWNEYENDGCSFISLDIFNNNLHEFKCYLHQDSVQKSCFRNEREIPNHIEWGEYSFSLVHSKNDISNIRKIAHRIKPMLAEEAEDYVKSLFDSANAIEYMDKFLRISDTITSITKTKRYPVIGGGFTIDKSTDNIKEIKLYYSLMHFESCYDEYCDNINSVRELSSSKLIDELKDKNLCSIYSEINDAFRKYNVPLSLFGINEDVTTNRQTNKFYYRDWKNETANLTELIDDVHYILFNTHLDEKYVYAIKEIIKQGYKQGEICICSDGTNSMLKLCYEA